MTTTWRKLLIAASAVVLATAACTPTDTGTAAK